MKTRIAIIGGGASGLFSALFAAIQRDILHKDISITIFEGQEKVAKKLLITGSSQCNITNNGDMLPHYYEKKKEVESILTSYTVEETKTLFTQLGLSLTVREDGKIFPSSFRSIDVINALLKECTRRNITITYNSRIENIRVNNNKFYINNTSTTSCDAIIIATGGLTFPKTGSRGDGYQLAQNLGHSIITPRVALTGVRVHDNALHSLSGLTLEKAAVEITKNTWETGSLLITHDGLSGPVIINNSRYLKSGDTINVCYVVDEMGMRRVAKEVQKEIASLCQTMGKSMFKTVLATYPLPSSLIEYLLEKNNIDGKKKASEVGKKTLIAIASSLTQEPYIVNLDTMENKAMITSGGISLDEINLHTMESTIVPHLYFCGEVIDIDGQTGGYNLQMAWSTGAISGKNAVKNLTQTLN